MVNSIQTRDPSRHSIFWGRRVFHWRPEHARAAKPRESGRDEWPSKKIWQSGGISGLSQNREIQARIDTKRAGVLAHRFELDRRNALAHAIVATIREPLIVLDSDLRVVAASGSFYRLFQLEAETTQGCLFHELSGGQLSLPGLRQLLEDVIRHNMVVEGYEIEIDLPDAGRRFMLLNARLVLEQEQSHPALLVALQDVTARHEADRLKDLLLQQQKTLVLEIQHRVANSLQIIASILLLKMRTVTSNEIRLHLRDAHQRVIAVAMVQQQLREGDFGGRIEIGPYLSGLCESLAKSMISDDRALTVRSVATGNKTLSGDAVSLGLIVTELVINALKHGFPDGREGHIDVAFDGNETGWRLSISDDGVGKHPEPGRIARVGLGTSIVEALARQLDARIELSDEIPGTRVSIIHGESRP
jgi:chemotaxis protein methyltransferase CheR